ncbi:MAG: hypothetical protein H6995_11900 [Pseudomonadales bacterium]|nr:hypothetical protein [Pseudomonadales bacterium]
MQPESKLHLIRLIHTVVWFVFATCIFAIPIYTYKGDLAISAVLIGIVMLEVTVLVFNNMRCPLTKVAARYTKNRRDNFDIYLPLWLAQQNKLIFGILFVVGAVYTLILCVSAQVVT